MRNPKNYEFHNCCPEEWKRTPDMTGSYEMDGMIMRTKNKDMCDRLRDHLVGDQAYKQRTGYGAYNGIG